MIPEVLYIAGESDSKTVLDAFFLGKALGEALTERIESTVGEFLSTIGRLQSEQQKQVLEFQVGSYLNPENPVYRTTISFPCLFMDVNSVHASGALCRTVHVTT